MWLERAKNVRDFRDLQLLRFCSAMTFSNKTSFLDGRRTPGEHTGRKGFRLYHILGCAPKIAPAFCIHFYSDLDNLT